MKKARYYVEYRDESWAIIDRAYENATNRADMEIVRSGFDTRRDADNFCHHCNDEEALKQYDPCCR